MDEYKGSLGINELSSNLKNSLNDMVEGLEQLQGLSRKKYEINIRNNFKEISDLTKVSKEELLEYFEAFNKQGRSKYFTEEAKMIQNVKNAFDDYKKDVTDKKAESQLMIWSRAYEAMYGSLEKILPEADKLQKVLWSNPNKSNGRVQYTVESFKELFSVMKEMSNRGLDMSEFTKPLIDGIDEARKRIKSQGYVVTAEDLIDDGGIEKAILKIEKSFNSYREQIKKINELQDEQDRLQQIIDTPELAGKYSTEELNKFQAKINSISNDIIKLQSNYDEDVFGINSSSIIADISQLEKLYDSIGKKMPKFFTDLKRDIIQNSEIDLSEFIKFGQDDANQIINRITNRIRRTKTPKDTSINRSASSINDVISSEEELMRILSSEESVTDEVTDSMGDDFDEVKQEIREASEEVEEFGNIIKASISGESLQPLVGILDQISQHLKSIKDALGSVDDTNGFTNIISSVDILLTKLEEMYQKIGTGVNNITINQGIDKTAQQQSAATNDYLRSTMSRYKKAYSRVSDIAGGEERLFAYINTAINYKGGIDQLYKTFGSANVSEIQSAEGQIYRLIDFFKVLKEAMASDEFGLNLSKVKIPSTDDSYFRSKLREKSGAKKTEEEILNFEDEKIDLTEITERLTEIRDLISEISQKDLFKDSIDGIINKMDTLVSKFDAIVADVNIINDIPIKTINQTDEPLEIKTTSDIDSDSIDKTTESIYSEGEAASIAAKQKEEFIKANDEISNSTDSSKVVEASEAIESEGKNAIEAAEQKEKFAEANVEVANSATSTVAEVNKATEAIESEGEVAEETAEIGKELSSLYEDKSGQLSFFENETEAKIESKNASEELLDAEKKRNAELKDIPGQITIDEYTERIKKAQREAEILNNKIEQQRQLLNNKSVKSNSGFEYSDELSTRIIAVNEKIQSLKDKLKSVGDVEGLNLWKTEFAAVKAEIDGVNKSISEEERIAKETARAQSDAAKSRKNAAKEQEAINERALKDMTQQTKLLADFRQWVARNSAAYKAYGEEIDSVFEKLDSGAKLSTEELRSVTDEINRIKANAAESGKLGGTIASMIGQRFKSLIAHLSTFVQFYDIIRYIREAATAVQELDKQMVELAKVSEQSLNQIKGDFSSYSDVAKNLGATISDTISATADWARLGYNVPDAKQLAEVALLYKNVGDGIDITSANQSLISTLQGYQMQADEAEHIVDVFNEVANNYAIDTAGIGEALQRSAASLNAANTSLEQSVALVTAANTVVQNPESVGTTFKTLSARIRGATTELEDLGEETDEYTQTTSKLQGLVKSLTGFDILEGDQKTFKSIYDILIGIGKEWKNLDDIEQASLGEALAGKRNANTLYAILDNIETLENAYETAENSAGKQNCLIM